MARWLQRHAAIPDNYKLQIITKKQTISADEKAFDDMCRSVTILVLI